jgi:hypothetical protein
VEKKIKNSRIHNTYCIELFDLGGQGFRKCFRQDYTGKHDWEEDRFLLHCETVSCCSTPFQNIIIFIFKMGGRAFVSAFGTDEYYNKSCLKYNL